MNSQYNYTKEKFQIDLMNLQSKIANSIDLTKYQFLTDENFQKYVTILDKSDQDLKAKYCHDNFNIHELCNDLNKKFQINSLLTNQIFAQLESTELIKFTSIIKRILATQNSDLNLFIKQFIRVIVQHRDQGCKNLYIKEHQKKEKQEVEKDQNEQTIQVLKDKIKYLEDQRQTNIMRLDDYDCKIQLISKQLNVLIDINQIFGGLVQANQTIFKNFKQKIERYSMMLDQSYNNQAKTKRYKNFDNLNNCQIDSFDQFQKYYDIFQKNNIKHQLTQIQTQKEDIQIYEFQNRILKDHIDTRESVINQCRNLDLQKTIKYLYIHLNDLKTAQKNSCSTEENLQFSLEEFLDDNEQKKQYNMIQKQKKMQLENQTKKLQKDIEKTDNRIKNIKVQMIEQETQYEEQLDIFQSMDKQAKKDKKKLVLNNLYSRVDYLEEELKETKEKLEQELKLNAQIKDEFQRESGALKQTIYNDEFEKKNLNYKLENVTQKIMIMNKLAHKDSEKQILEKLSAKNLSLKDTIVNLQFKIKTIQDKIKKKGIFKNDEDLMKQFDITDTYEEEYQEFINTENKSSIGLVSELQKKLDISQKENESMNSLNNICNTKIRNLQNKLDQLEKKIKEGQNKVPEQFKPQFKKIPVQDDQNKQVAFNIPVENNQQTYQSNEIQENQEQQQQEQKQEQLQEQLQQKIEQLQAQKQSLKIENTNLQEKIAQLVKQAAQVQQEDKQLNIETNVKQRKSSLINQIGVKSARVSKVQKIQTPNIKIERNSSTANKQEKQKPKLLKSIDENQFQNTEQKFFQADKIQNEDFYDEKIKSDTKSIDLENKTMKNNSQASNFQNMSTKNPSVKMESAKMTSIKSASTFYRNENNYEIKEQLEPVQSMHQRQSFMGRNQRQSSFQMGRPSLLFNGRGRNSVFEIEQFDQFINNQEINKHFVDEGIDQNLKDLVLKSIRNFIQKGDVQTVQVPKKINSSIALITKSKVATTKQTMIINQIFQSQNDKKEILTEVLEQEAVDNLFNCKEIHTLKGFMNIIKLIDKQHQNYGRQMCKHLSRFYERLGYKMEDKECLSLGSNAIKQLPITKQNIMNVL